MKKNLNLLIALFLGLYSQSFAGYKFSEARFYQSTGTFTAGSKNNPILWGKFDGTSSSYSGGWGISQLRFTMVNSMPNSVTKAKIFYNTSNNFSTAVLKDSILNPSNSLSFTINGVSNLGIISVYFFLTYDIANVVCPGSTFDATVPSGSITITGNVAGIKSAVSGSNPSGNSSVSGIAPVPSVSIIGNTSICYGSNLTLTPLALNGGSNPSYLWYLNGVLKGTSNGPYTFSNVPNQAKIYCILTSDLLCASPTTAKASTKTITVTSYINTVKISGDTVLYEGTTGYYTSAIQNGGAAPTYQWYKNGVAISGATKNYLYEDQINNGDKITCKLSSSKSCTTPIVATSNAINIQTLKKSRTAAILDFSALNGEIYQNNLFSAKHILDVAGIPYIVTPEIKIAQNYPFVLCTSWLDSITFSSNEDTILTNYVRNGGTIIFPRIKNNKLKNVAGISNFYNATNRYKLNWNMAGNDASLRWLDDSLEQQISLGRNDNPVVIDTRSYTLSTGIPLAYYEDGSVAVVKNTFGSGTAYCFGISLNDMVFRPQLNLDYNAQRIYSNGFEPTTDAVILWIKAIYAQKVPYAVWKNTSPGKSKASVIITHDIDASSGCIVMPSFADYEDSANISATYFITTHYIADYFAGNFWNGYTAQRQYLLNKKQSIGSHSVGHFPDMEDENTIPVGSIGNTQANYQPSNNGNTTIGASIYGEVEVSKKLLDAELGINVLSYRPGFLYQHNQQINAMKDLGYKYSSSMSANDVLTSFPYLTHEDKAFEGNTTDILEIPMSISDAQISDKLDSTNWQRHVSNWLYCTNKNADNGAPTTLLIHPNRTYKLSAERSYVNQLGSNFYIGNIENFGAYWNMRNKITFSSTMTDSKNLQITIPRANLPLNASFSMVVDNGQNLTSIRVVDEYNSAISLKQMNWLNNSKILYNDMISPSASSRLSILNESEASSICNEGLNAIAYPNPFKNLITIEYNLSHEAPVLLEIYNMYGMLILTLADETQAAGIHKKYFYADNFKPGIYLYQLSINGQTKTEKIMLEE